MAQPSEFQAQAELYFPRVPVEGIDEAEAGVGDIHSSGGRGQRRGLASGQVGPVEDVKDLHAALEELTRAARAVKDLADTLERHPEALLRGKGETP